MTVILPPYRDLLERSDEPPGSAWGVFGRTDQLGTLNVLTPERRVAAARLVRRGAVFNLDHSLDLPAIPFFPHRARPTHIIVMRRGGNSREDYLHNFSPQYSSQWDGLRHMRHPVHGFYNWTPDEEADRPDGRLGIEHLARHGIIGRGVLLDVVRFLAARGEPLALGVRCELPCTLLDEVAAAQGVELRAGDIVLFRTGVGAMIRREAADVARALPRDYAGPDLAPGDATLAWLWDRHVAAIASDNLVIEAWPRRSDETFLHFRAIPLVGLVFGELFDLEDLADDCAADRVNEVCFVAKPLVLRGGVASPANAIALK